MRRLKEHLTALPVEEETVSLLYKVKAIGQIECLTLTVGAVPVECAALVVGECVCVKMKLQRHVKIKIETLLFCSKSLSLVLGREGGRRRMCSAGLCWRPQARALPCRWRNHRVSLQARPPALVSSCLPPE